LPTSWYNIQADLPEPVDPPLSPMTKEPAGPEIHPLFPMELIKQEMSQERYIEIPDEVQHVYKLFRPTPLQRAYRLEKELDTPAKIFYKNESVSPRGATSLIRPYRRRTTTRWKASSASAQRPGGPVGKRPLAWVQVLRIELEVYMVQGQFRAEPYRRAMMEVWGAKVHASPTDETESGRAVLAETELPWQPGSPSARPWKMR